MGKCSKDYEYDKGFLMVVIGSSSGIGKCIQKYFGAVGLDKLDGKDISTAEGRSNVVEASRLHDVIVLNSFDKVNRSAQLETFFCLYNNFKDVNKTIIVIGSCSQDRWAEHNGEYQSYKYALDYACMNASRHRNPCKVINIRLGHTATLSNQKPNRNNKSIDPYSVPVAIEKLLEMPEDMLPAQITILPSTEGVTDAII